MSAKLKNPSARREQELSERLSGLLTQRDHGLLTQREFEEELEQVRCSVPRAGSLTETGLREGGTRFVLRDTGTGEVLARFEFRRAYHADI